MGRRRGESTVGGRSGGGGALGGCGGELTRTRIGRSMAETRGGGDETLRGAKGGGRGGGLGRGGRGQAIVDAIGSV